MSLDSDIEFLQRCYGVTATEAKNILKVRNLKDAMANLEQRGFKANQEVIEEFKKTKKSNLSNKKDEMYVGSGQVVNKPNRECKLIFYIDGIMINDDFVECSKENLDSFKKMVENGEFDANLLNGKDNEFRDFQIEYRDMPFKQTKETFAGSTSFSKLPGAGKRRIPRYLSLDRSDSSVPLEVFFSEEIRTVHISNNNTVNELLELCTKYSTNEIQFFSDGKEIKKSDKLAKYIGKSNKIE